MDGSTKARDILGTARELCLECRTSSQLHLLIDIGLAQSRAGDAVGSTETFKLAVELVRHIKDPRDHYRVLLAIVEAQAKAGKKDDAVRTSRLSRSSVHRARLLQMIAATCSEAGHMQDALTVVALIPEKYARERSVAISLIAFETASHGGCSRALQVLQDVSVDMPLAHNLLLRRTAGFVLKAGEDKEIEKASHKAVALLEVARCLARAERFTEAINVAETIGFGCFRDRALRTIASIAANTGDLSVSRRVATQIRNVDEKSLAMGDIAVAAAAKGLLKNALKTASAITRAQYRGKTIIRIAVVLAQSGNHKEAKKTLSAAEKEQIDPASRMAAQISIGKAFAKHGEFASARSIAERLSDQSARARIMVAIALEYARIGNTVDAEKSFQEGLQCALAIGDPYRVTKVLCAVAASQAEALDSTGAVRTLKEAVRIAKTIPAEGGTNVLALRDVAIAQAKAGNQMAARATFRDAMNAARAYEDEEYVARLCQDVMKAETECDDPQTALECANGLESCLIKCRSLLGIAIALVEKGREKEGGK